MNGYGAEEWARWHQQDLLDEASRARLAAIAGRRTNDRVPDGSESPWRRLIRSVVSDLSAWLPDGNIGSASHRA